MNRMDRFMVSKAPYAIDPASLTVSWREFPGHRNGRGGDYACGVRAVWFRRRAGVTAAMIGQLQHCLDEAPADAEDFARQYTDGRCGGLTLGRWDGLGYWGSESPEVQARHLAVLRPMLENFPAIPPGFEGWFTFHEVR